VATGPCTGRFAPSPTGPLHAGSAVAALASWLDARAQGGRWLVRIEDVDTPRCLPGGGEVILGQLAALGLVPDAPPLWQSTRGAAYQAALDQLLAAGLAYPCGCSRREIDAAWRRWASPRPLCRAVYPGTCRRGLHGKPARATRLRTVMGGAGRADPPGPTAAWARSSRDVAQAVGDFILHRADGLWAYQLAVVVDDAAQGITDVVRGEDLADNTARQIHLQRLLGLPTPRYLHTPLVLAADGHKLSKQNGAAGAGHPPAAGHAARPAAVLGLPPPARHHPGDWLAQATPLPAWAAAWPCKPEGHGAMA
jgi:glutamyl-Q tRNA(Asp) synthetase